MNGLGSIEWWTPIERPAYVLWTEDGGVENGPMLGADEVICDCCNGDVLITPVPVVGGSGLCPDCFKEMFGISVEEAARKAGVSLKNLEDASPGCQGEGRTSEGSEDSDGRCNACSGTGLISCSECQGEGRIPDASGCGEESGGWADRCDTCSGTGLVSCPECQGEALKDKEEV